jgi:hypothetical protein
VHAAVNCKVCEIAIVLEVIVVKSCKRTLHAVTNRDPPADNHMRDSRFKKIIYMDSMKQRSIIYVESIKHNKDAEINLMLIKQ